MPHLRAMRDTERLATYARRRRLFLGLRQKQVAARAGLSKLTVGAVEAGRNVDDLTLWKLDRALSWQEGSAEEILHGGEPTPLSVPEPQGLHDDVERQLWGVTLLPEERRWEIIHRYREELADNPTQTDQKRSKVC